MFKFKMSLLVKSAKFKVALVTLILAAIVAGVVYIPKNRASQVNAQSVNYDLSSSDIISKALLLVGKKYSGGTASNKNGKGYSADIWKYNYDQSKLLPASEVGNTEKSEGVDCSGLIFWTLASAMKDKNIKTGTSGFVINNPVPVDTFNWVADSNQKAITKNSNVTFNGKKINILKANDTITSDLRYYQYKDSNGTVKTLPSGTIIISIVSSQAKKEMPVQNHAWIYIGDLKTSKPEEVKKILKDEYNVDIDVKDIHSYGNCTHWRIEASAGEGIGVNVNNMDPNDGYVQAKKGVGKIYAFQFASEPVKITGKYSVELVKVKEDGKTVIPTNEAVFNVNNKNITTNSGKLSITANKSINDIKNTDSYEITEVTAPDGYELYTGTLNLNVSFKKQDGKFVIDEEKTRANSKGFANTTKFYVSNDGTKITVYVPNKEEVIVEEEFDMSLRKFISKINDKNVVPSRVPVIDNESIEVLESTGTAAYHHNKNSLMVSAGDEVEYTIRVYNEGEILSYAKEITDYLPEGLSFARIADESAKEYTTDSKAGSKVVCLKYNGNKNIKSLRDFIGKNVNVTAEYYQEVKIICNVINTKATYITSRAEITNYGYSKKDENGKIIYCEAKAIKNVDIDSVQKTISNSLSLDTWYENAKTFEYVKENSKVAIKDYYPGVQDDDDFETVELIRDFDLSLRKFITEVNGKKIEDSREPKVDVKNLSNGKETTAEYNHPKNPLEVNTTDIVTYTIRVYNEGETDGYATKVMDDIPEGLEFVPAEFDENGKALNTNAKYKWELDKEANVIVTNYLSIENGKNNLIKAFDGKNLDYKDLKVEFKVVEPKTSDRIITNSAQITEHADYKGNKVIVDRDSTPNKWIEGEDDQDIEKVKVRYFDLALVKYVTKAIVIEDGKESVTETGHTGKENPEPVVKVDLQNTKLDKVTVKFEYVIKVTNEGQVEGYAKEISDYVPEGLKFVAEDNKNWKEVDGKIVTNELADKLLQPGESAEVTVILTWINGKDNMGIKTNVAEISKDYNKYGTPDIDSTPNNRVEGEDDIDNASVMLSIRTGGSSTSYIFVGLACIVIISSGIVCIKKFVLK